MNKLISLKYDNFNTKIDNSKAILGNNENKNKNQEYVYNKSKHYKYISDICKHIYTFSGTSSNLELTNTKNKDERYGYIFFHNKIIFNTNIWIKNNKAFDLIHNENKDYTIRKIENNFDEV